MGKPAVKIKRDSMLMTEGGIAGKLILFAIPLLLGNLFQQLYNAVDSVVVGRYVGIHALAAVSSSTPLINLIMNLFYGIGVGGSIVVSRYFGARNKEGLSKAVHTFAAFAVCSGVAATAIGMMFSPSLLRLMSTPESVMVEAVQYFRIYFASCLALVTYNMGSGLLRAVGDSRRPVRFLMAASITNIVLDLLFVAGFSWGVRGAALATSISQYLSAVLIVKALMQTTEDYRLQPKRIRFWKEEMKQIFRIGFPTGIQQSISGVSNVIVQSNINVFGAAVVAGCGTAMKLDSFNMLFVQSVALALTTFVGQNSGAKNYDRVKSGMKVGMLLTFGISGVISAILYVFTPQLLQIFTTDEATIANGIRMIHLLAWFYPLMSMCETGVAGVRGAGLSLPPMLIMVTCYCLIRVSWIVLVGRPAHNLTLVLLGYPISWTAGLIAIVGFMMLTDWSRGDGRILLFNRKMEN